MASWQPKTYYAYYYYVAVRIRHANLWRRCGQISSLTPIIGERVFFAIKFYRINRIMKSLVIGFSSSLFVHIQLISTHASQFVLVFVHFGREVIFSWNQKSSWSNNNRVSRAGSSQMRSFYGNTTLRREASSTDYFISLSAYRSLEHRI